MIGPNQKTSFQVLTWWGADNVWSGLWRKCRSHSFRFVSFLAIVGKRNVVSMLDLLSEVSWKVESSNTNELISLIDLCLRLEDCEIMGRARSCDGCDLINLIGLCLRLEGFEVMDQTRSCGEIVLISISEVNEKYPLYFS